MNIFPFQIEPKLTNSIITELIRINSLLILVKNVLLLLQITHRAKKALFSLQNLLLLQLHLLQRTQQVLVIEIQKFLMSTQTVLIFVFIENRLFDQIMSNNSSTDLLITMQRDVIVDFFHFIQVLKGLIYIQLIMIIIEI